MSTKRFKFVSPGVFLNEIDNSRVPRVLDAVGPTIVGRTEKGPGMIPLTVNSMTEFVEVFGNPIPGGRTDDAWRNGNYSTPQYAAYAAQAFLRNSGPVNVVRLLGTEDVSAGPAGVAGWKLAGTDRGTLAGDLPTETQGMAYGLYLFSTGGVDPRGGYNPNSAGAIQKNSKVTKANMTGSLAAVWYMESAGIILSGNLAQLDDTKTNCAAYNNKGATAAQGATFTIIVNTDTNAISVDDTFTVTTLRGSTITLEANANTTGIKAGFDASGDATITYSIQTNNDDAVGAVIATALKLHDDIDSTTTVFDAATDTVTVKMSTPGQGTVAANVTHADNADGITFGAITQYNRNHLEPVTGSHVLIESSDSTKFEFVAYLYDGATGGTPATEAKNERKDGITLGKRVVFNFDRDSDKYIRRVFNTNPALMNSVTTDTENVEKYFLGETFDRYVKDVHGRTATLPENHKGILGTPTASPVVAAILPIGETDLIDDRTLPNQDSVTNWVISQDTTTNASAYAPQKMKKLFKFIGISDGGWNTSNIKISIVGIKCGNQTDPYGSFTVLVRRVNDNDGRMVVLERFSECSLNPNSKNYIGRKIGDQYREWDEADSRYRVYGEYANQSSLIRVKPHGDLDAGVLDPELLPFGFYGPPRYATGKVTSAGLTNAAGFIAATRGAETSDVLVNFAPTHPFRGLGAADTATFGLAGLPSAATASLIYPSLPLRVSSSEEGLSNPKSACFGISTYRSPTDTRFDQSYIDVVRRLGKSFASTDESGVISTKSETSFYFSCDDLVAIHKTASYKVDQDGQGDMNAADIGGAVYASGSRRDLQSYTANKEGYKELVKSGVCNFTMPMYGGFDGFDTFEKDPLRNTAMSGDETTNYELATLKRAVDTVSDPEIIEMNALVAPGITNARITNQMIRVCEDRADAIAIIDIENGGYVPNCEGTDDFKTRIQNTKPRAAIDILESRGLNSSYACAFYPWVKIVDQVADQQLWAPPSVAALGTFGSTESQSELWFAPAGFTRGGLSEGAAGLPVLAVSQRVSSKERDELYEANINPIAQFPAEGIVVFGQKTLQITPSALDRINVRRLMIFVKKEISRIAARLLFEQNVQATWDRFKGQVEPFLDSVKSRFGLTEFKVILDETTTTPDLVDRNIMYAKIFLKPARSIEFIAIDFVITNSGASFEE
jgi:phage tail sheath protein FI